MDKRDRLLPNAGALLVAVGGLAAFTGGIHGLSAREPFLVVLSIVLLMGYGVAGFLLMSRGSTYFHLVLPGTAVLVLATLFLFQERSSGFVDDDVQAYVLDPLLTLLLAFAGGALLTHALEHVSPRFVWPSNGTGLLNPGLHLAAYVPVWSAFTLLEMMGTRASALFKVLVIGGSVLAAVACSVGGHAASRRLHPRITTIGATTGFIASAAFLYQFMLGGGNPDAAAFGQLNALVGLVVTGLAVAVSLVAWVQTAPEPAEMAAEA